MNGLITLNRRYHREIGAPPLDTDTEGTLDETTDQILEELEDPERDGPWDRRGLVVGHVQSGKTANYAGLVAKAADAFPIDGPVGDLKSQHCLSARDNCLFG
jgi:hypothetical protein